MACHCLWYEVTIPFWELPLQPLLTTHMSKCSNGPPHQRVLESRKEGGDGHKKIGLLFNELYL